MNICFNGEFYPAQTLLLSAQNRSYKWGDGLFETMKVYQNRLLLQELHFERLFSGLRLLQITPTERFTSGHLIQHILALCAQNNCTESARVRLAVYRTDENMTGFTIEATPLDGSINQWQEDGLSLCLYPHVRKGMDAFANLKSANYLPYVLAQRFAEEKGVGDAVVLNAANALCDTSKANIFLIKGTAVYTPALHQGCVNGVMRRMVMAEVKRLGFRLQHDEITEEQLWQADEVFLTNAIQIIRWVNRYKTKSYGCTQTSKIFDALAPTIFADHG